MMFDVDQGKLISELATELKRQNVVVPPGWAAFAKTGHHREKAPAEEDWWYTRAASILRIIYLRGPVGTEKLRVKYGGRKNRGMAPDRFYAAGGNHIRKILQQLEMAKLIQQVEKGVHKGRVITPLGRKLIHAIAGIVDAKRPVAEAPEKKAAPKADEPKAAAPAKTAAAPAKAEETKAAAPAKAAAAPEKTEEPKTATAPTEGS